MTETTEFLFTVLENLKHPRNIIDFMTSPISDMGSLDSTIGCFVMTGVLSFISAHAVITGAFA